jgi:hypothetical protein
MTNIFEQVELTWRGDPYVIPPKRVLAAIEQVERVITLGELANPTQLPLARLARAYATLLRFAGCSVRDDEVYAALWTEDDRNAATLVTALIDVMVPRKVRERKTASPDAAQAE